MGRSGAFLEVGRRAHDTRPARQAVGDHDDIVVVLSTADQRQQASRCMACGVAFCQSNLVFAGRRQATGCPLRNLIPETNDLFYRGRMADAAQRLALTNPFPEFTGRVCPAPCEDACNLGLHDDAVTIHDNERAISDWAWRNDAVQPLPAAPGDAPLVVVGSGPAGLACAWELARRGFRVKVIEQADRPGGLLMYGIPNMKLPKQVVQRRIELMRRSGIEFLCDCDAAAQLGQLAAGAAAVVVAVGARKPRELGIEGLGLPGVVQGVDYLSADTRALLAGEQPAVSAQGLDVVVLGGGDTGTDCVATALRQGARSVTQVIRAACPPTAPAQGRGWPGPRGLLSLGYGHQEALEVHGADPRIWSTDTLAICGGDAVQGVMLQDLSYDGERHLVQGTQRQLPAQLVVLAKGFAGPEPAVFEAAGVQLQAGKPVVQPGSHRLVANQGAPDALAATVPCFVAGDALNGATLVSTAIADALACSAEVAEAVEAAHAAGAAGA